MSEPFVATYNQNASVTSAQSRLILASDHAAASISLDNPANAGITWLGEAQREAGRHIAPYIGIEYTDSEGNSLAMVNPMSLEMYQKAEAQSSGQSVIEYTITNPVGMRLSAPGAFTETLSDTISVTLYSHNDSQAPEQTFSLLETGLDTLEFRDSENRLALRVVTSMDPEESPPPPQELDANIPDIISISAAGIYNDSPFAIQPDLLETGAGTREFVDQTVEVHFVAGNRDLPSTASNTSTVKLRSLSEIAMDLSMTETAPGSRVFKDASDLATLDLTQIINGRNEAVTAPRPDTHDSLYGKITVASWGVTNSPVLLREEGQDSPEYANIVEPSKTVAAAGAQPPPGPTLQEIQEGVLKHKKFFIEVHDPSLADGTQVEAKFTGEDGVTVTENFTLRRTDGLRLKTEQQIISFGGPPYQGGTSQFASSRSGRRESDILPIIPGCYAKKFDKLETKVQLEYRAIYGQAIKGISYVALGDSMTAGVSAGQQVYYNQVMAYPRRLAEQLGLPMPLPLFDYPGMPAHRLPNALRPEPSIDFLFDPGAPRRLNPNYLCTDLGISGADVINTVIDRPMCNEKRGAMAWLAGGSLEKARQAILTNSLPACRAGSCPIERHAPVDWIAKMPTPPALVTTWIGGNDALAVAIGAKKTEGEYLDGNSMLCKVSSQCGQETHDNERDLTGVASFKTYYKLLLLKLARAYYDEGANDGAGGPRSDVKPLLIFGTVPDVTVIPLLGKIVEGKQEIDGNGLNNGLVYKPFKDSLFRAWFRVPHYGWRNLTAFFKDASVEIINPPQPDGRPDTVYGRVGAMAFLKHLVNPLTLIAHTRTPDAWSEWVATALGHTTTTEGDILKHKAVVVDYSQPCKTEQGFLVEGVAGGEGEALKDVAYTSNRIVEFNKTILQVLYTETNWDDAVAASMAADQHLDALTEADKEHAKAVIESWRKEGQIHVFDAHWALSSLAKASLNLQGSECTEIFCDYNRTLNELAIEAGIQDGTMAWEVLAADQDIVGPSFADDPSNPSAYVKHMESKRFLRTPGQKGVFGADFIHPTWTAHASVTNILRDLLHKLCLNGYPVPSTPISLDSAQPINLDELSTEDPWSPNYVRH